MAFNDETEVSPEAGATPAAASSDVNWADFAVDSDDEGAFVAEPVVGQDSGDDAPADTPQADSVQVPSSESTAPVTPPAQSNQAPTASPQEQQPTSPQAAPEPTQPVAPQQSSEELRAKYLEDLQNHYAISQEDALAITTQPETVMPRIAAQLHMNVMQEVTRQLQQVMQTVPHLMEAQLHRQTRETEAKQVFYKSWPGLESHHDAVVRNAAMFRQANPQATREQVIEAAGTLTALALGADPQTFRVASGAAGSPPAPVQRPSAPSGVPPRPIAAGSGPSGLPQRSENVFEQFAEDDQDFLKG